MINKFLYFKKKESYFVQFYELKGVALLMVMISLAFISAVVMDLGYQENIHYKLAIYQRDAAKAQALAEGGINIACLFLTVREKLQVYLANLAASGVALPNHTIWTLLRLESSLFKNLIRKKSENFLGINTKESFFKGLEKNNYRRNLKKFTKPIGGFGYFNGFFKVEIVDEDSKISLVNFAKSNSQKKRIITKNMLLALLDEDRYNDIFKDCRFIKYPLDRLEFIGSIFGYIDVHDHIIDVRVKDKQWGFKGSGSKKNLYAEYYNLSPKGANFDSFEEMRLVHGMTDAHMDILQDAVSVYGLSKKINILSASNKILQTLVRYCASDSLGYILKNPQFMDEIIIGWNNYKNRVFGLVRTDDFIQFLKIKNLLIDNAKCKAVLGTTSQTFTIKSNATVGNVNKILTLVTRIAENSNELYYFNNN